MSCLLYKRPFDRLVRNNAGISMVGMLVGASLVFVCLVLAGKYFVQHKRLESTISNRISFETRRSLINLAFRSSVAKAVKGPLYISSGILNALGITWVTPSTQPVASMFVTPARQFSSSGTGLTSLSAGAPYDAIVVLREDTVPGLKLAGNDALLTSNQTTNGATFTLSVSGNLAPYTTNDILAMASPIGTQTVQLVSKTVLTPSTGNITVKVVTSGESLWASFLPVGMPIYRLQALVLGTKPNTDGSTSLIIRNYRPGSTSDIQSFKVVASRFKAETLGASANLDDSNIWTAAPSGYFEPNSKGYTLRLFYQDTALIPPRSASIMVSL